MQQPGAELHVTARSSALSQTSFRGHLQKNQPWRGRHRLFAHRHLLCNCEMIDAMFKETPHTHFGVAWSRLQSGKFLPTGTASFPTKCSQAARNTWPADHVLLLPRLGGASMSPAHKALVAGRLLFTVSLGAFIVSFTKDRNQRRAQPSPTLDANTSFG